MSIGPPGHLLLLSFCLRNFAYAPRRHRADQFKAVAVCAISDASRAARLETQEVSCE